MSNIDIFTNEKFRILSYLYDIKGKDNLVKITQTELVTELLTECLTLKLL